MNAIDFEAQVIDFLDACDAWLKKRIRDLDAQGFTIPPNTTEALSIKLESDMTSLIEQGVTVHQESFQPHILTELHHLIAELELKKLGVQNQEQIHCYKDNGQVALSVIEGKLKPENALLVMEINRAHRQKKGGSENGVCEDCVCGKKEPLNPA